VPGLLFGPAHAKNDLTPFSNTYRLNGWHSTMAAMGIRLRSRRAPARTCAS